MNIYTITIQFISDRKRITRTEWGKRRADAIKTLESIYGKDSFKVVDDTRKPASCKARKGR